MEIRAFPLTLQLSWRHSGGCVLCRLLSGFHLTAMMDSSWELQPSPVFLPSGRCFLSTDKHSLECQLEPSALGRRANSGALVLEGHVSRCYYGDKGSKTILDTSWGSGPWHCLLFVLAEYLNPLPDLHYHERSQTCHGVSLSPHPP